MTTKEHLTVWKVEDHEGDGECTACGKTGLRWVTFMSDGSRVGGECAKRLLGWSPTKSSHGWVAGMEPVAETSEYGDRWVLWHAREGFKAVISRNGHAQTVGGKGALQKEWERKFG